MDIYDLKTKCNGKSSCSYIRSRRWRTCHSRYLSLTKSIIQYDCVRYYSETTTSVTILPSSESTKVTAFTESNTQYRKYTTSNQHSTSIGRMNTNTPVTSTMSPLQAPSNKSNDDAVIAGSVIGVLGALALIFLLGCFVMKRRKTDKHKTTRQESVSNVVSQNSNVLYVVSENGPSIPGRDDDEPPAYSSVDDIPDQNHIYINADYEKGQDLNHQQTNYYNHIHGTGVRNPLQNDNYNHTDSEALKISGRQGDDYNHISVSGRSENLPTEMDDGYNHIRSTEGAVSHGTDDNNHIGGHTDGGEENTGYLADDYSHLDNSKKQNTSEGEQSTGMENRVMQRSNNESESENDYANIGRQIVNDDANDFEPDDTYIYT
ncbi:hypothetical protein LOTGIDRAFT_155348 [Lottia gigantea]|uniref:Uncharacterized protein n=1 Tax=Lottia gigantea TaxID=225164 RepID=V3ZII8_LOTGI|nr:hypothetical protein LOTGIDRAFT_155348 [Lottia gigantea]ESO84032.1 hypothetical protein LOTGIDRAFT_155348 [Lottia gigantea]